MSKKDDKVGNKTACKRKRHREKEESERKFKIVQILAYVHTRKTKELFNCIQLAEIEVLSVGIIFLAISMLIARKTVPKADLVKIRFFPQKIG